MMYNKTKKQVAVLIDPDKTDPAKVKKIVLAAEKAEVDFFLVGGSLLLRNNLEETIDAIRQYSGKKIYLFPGNPTQISEKADGILLLSLISGRNAELLIGQHVQAAPALKASGLVILPTGYILVDGGKATTVSYISNTTPIPADKPEIAVCTAMAGEMLGLRAIYLEAGSGAESPVPAEMIKLVNQSIKVPLIVGGGIRTIAQARKALNAGADVIVIGTAIENDIRFLNGLKTIKR
jgi:phosphoglycerol geranylgeranyltransferase